MKDDKKNFLHESLQNSEAIVEILNAISNGLEKGQLTFSDDGNDIVFKPQGLLRLKVAAAQDGNRHRFNLKVSWQSKGEKITQKKLQVKTD